MFNPEEHPALQPTTSGKARRYVVGTRIIRPVRFDDQSDNDLNFLRRHLALPHDCRDMASVSMVCRRAVHLYRNHVVYHFNDPVKITEERKAIRALTKPPGRKRKKKVASN